MIVIVRFKSVGNAPIMKQNFYKISASNRFQTVIQFLRKELGWKSGDALVSGSFYPTLSLYKEVTEKILIYSILYGHWSKNVFLCYVVHIY